MTSITVGLIPVSGMPQNMIDKIIDELPKIKNDAVDDKCDWYLEVEVSPLASSAEYINETILRMVKIKEKNDWDYTILDYHLS